MPYVEARTKSHGLKECASFRRSCAAACQTSVRASTCVASLHGNEKKRTEGAEEFTVGAGVGERVGLERELGESTAAAGRLSRDQLVAVFINASPYSTDFCSLPRQQRWIFLVAE